MRTVKIKEEHRKFLKPLIKSVEVAQDGAALAHGMYSNAQKDLWKILKEEYPELNGRRAVFEHPKDGEWELLIYGKEKTLRELQESANELGTRIKVLEAEVSNTLEKEMKPVSVEEESPNEESGDTDPPTDLSSPPE